MSETINISEVAEKLSKEIFEVFLWQLHPARNENFSCTNEEHKGKGGKPKSTHPTDVVFHYIDPYLGRRICLQTDLKSYGKESIKANALRDAFRSLCMALECAKTSEEWSTKYSINSSERYEVRGLLFVHNHDSGYENDFGEILDRVNLQNLPVPADSYLHFLGPHDIQRLYNIANDIIRLKGQKELPDEYTFYYPDLVMWRRQGDVWSQPATIESLTGSHLIIKYPQIDARSSGYIIYYNQSGATVDEFVYFIDILSRYQMLESNETIRIRVTAAKPDSNWRSNFHAARKRYVKDWGFESRREEILNKISIDEITSVTNTFNPGKMGWRE